MPDEIAVLRAALKDSPEAHDRLRALALSGKLGRAEEVPASQPLTVVAAPRHYGIDGAKQARCECGVTVWLSPSTQAMMMKRGTSPQAAPTTIVCVECFQKELKEAHAKARPQ